MLKQERYRLFVDYFSKNQPDAVTELHYSNPFELLVAVILSAQCTDKRINHVTPALFDATQRRNRSPDQPRKKFSLTYAV